MKNKLVETVVETSHQAEARYREAKAYVRDIDAEQAVCVLFFHFYFFFPIL